MSSPVNGKFIDPMRTQRLAPVFSPIDLTLTVRDPSEFAGNVHGQEGLTCSQKAQTNRIVTHVERGGAISNGPGKRARHRPTCRFECRAPTAKSSRSIPATSPPTEASP